MVIRWSLSNSKSYQIFWTLLSILSVLKSAVVWMVSTRPPTSKSPTLVTVTKASITIGTILTFVLHSFFNYLARSRCLSFFSHSFSFILWSTGTAKSKILKVFPFLLSIIIKSGLLIRLSVCMSNPHWSLYESFSETDAGLCIYNFFVWSNLNFLHISLWIPLSNQSCLVSNYFWANLLHSLIMWLMVSSRSPHNLHLLLFCVLSILALIWLVIMALFWAGIRKDSVSLIIIIYSFEFFTSTLADSISLEFEW